MPFLLLLLTTQLLAIKASLSIGFSANSVRLFCKKLISGMPLMVPVEMLPLAFTSTRLLPSNASKVSPSAACGVGRKRVSLKKARVLKVISPPSPSGAKARISLSSKATIALALRLISPPLPVVVESIVLMSLLLRRTIFFSCGDINITSA